MVRRVLRAVSCSCKLPCVCATPESVCTVLNWAWPPHTRVQHPRSCSSAAITAMLARTTGYSACRPHPHILLTSPPHPHLLLHPHTQPCCALTAAAPTGATLPPVPSGAWTVSCCRCPTARQAAPACWPRSWCWGTGASCAVCPARGATVPLKTMSAGKGEGVGDCLWESRVQSRGGKKG